MSNDTTPTQLSLFDVEQWRPVVGYEDTYAISDRGRVMRIKSVNRYPAGNILKPGNRNGYLFVILCRDGNNRAFDIHRLVMRAFVGECPKGITVNHKDGNKANNTLPNLEYCTQAENVKHAIASGLMPANSGEQCVWAKLTQAQVDEIRQLYSTEEYTQTALAKVFGVTQAAIGYIVRNKNWKVV